MIQVTIQATDQQGGTSRHGNASASCRHGHTSLGPSLMRKLPLPARRTENIHGWKRHRARPVGAFARQLAYSRSKRQKQLCGGTKGSSRAPVGIADG